MSRKDEFKSVSSNPATKFFEWDSTNGSFKYYDKEASANKMVKMPFKFLTLKELHTIKGWHGKSESGIVSNEITNMSEMLNVKSFKGGPIVVGLYKDIKDKLQGGVYHKSIYVMLGDGSIANISMKGACVAAWGDFTAKCKSRLPDEWVAVTGAEDQKNGSVKYTTPKFEFKATLTEKESADADNVYSTLKDYFSGYFSKQDEESAVRESVAVVPPATNKDVSKFENSKPAPVAAAFVAEDDDLPF
jgi:hypothetical protein